MSLTNRQSQILRAIIEDYIENAQPVASLQLVRQRDFNVCGATIRNIMADLVRKGYLQMLHVSSGRVPTEIAYRFYITELMEEQELSVIEEIALKQKIQKEIYEVERILREAANALSATTGMLSFAYTSEGYITYTGASKLLDTPEFFEIDTTRSVLRLVDDYELLKSVVDRSLQGEGILVLIGREIGLANMDNVTLIASKSNLRNKDSFVGLLGPSRMNYGKVIPIVRRTRRLLAEVAEKI